MKVALVHDWLTGMRGGEKCLEVFCELYPFADLYTLLHVRGTVSQVIEQRRIFTSFLQKIPGIRRNYRNYLPLFPMAIEQFDLRGYDLVLSSSHCVAKGVKRQNVPLHICYCYSPMRYIWDMYSSYFGKERRNFPARMAISIVRNYLRKWDVRTSARVDRFVAISHNVATRIQRHYGRGADVIHPPVDADFFTPDTRVRRKYYLIVSALVPYKRLDLAIEAFNTLGYPLKIVGAGPEEKRLKKLANANIELLGWKSNDELLDLYRGSRALVFPGEEDFGIVPLEAMACGRPVIAFGKGGALETVLPFRKQRSGEQDGILTGIFFYDQSVEALRKAVLDFEENTHCFHEEGIRRHAQRFHRSLFKKKISNCISEKYEEHLGAKKTQSILQKPAVSI